MRPRLAGLAALNAMPKSLRDDLAARDNIREWLELSSDYALSFAGAKSDTSRRAICDVVRKAMSTDAVGFHDVHDLDGNTWKIEVFSDDHARRVRLHPDGAPLELPHAYVFSSNPAERIAGFQADVSRLRLDQEAAAHWLSALEARSFSDEEFSKLHADLSATPEVVKASLYESIANLEMRVDVLVPEDDRYYLRLVGSISTPGGFDRYIELFAKEHLSGQAIVPDILHLCLHRSLSKEIAARVTSEQLITICDFAASAGAVPRVAAIEIALLAPTEISEPVEDKVKELVVSLVGVDAAEEGNLFERYVTLSAFILSQFAMRHQLCGSPAYVRRLSGLAHASILEQCLLDLEIDVAALDFSETTSDAALFFGSIVDFREENWWHADHLNPPEMRRWLIKRLLWAFTSETPTTLQLAVMEGVETAGIGREVSLRDLCSPDPIIAREQVAPLASALRERVQGSLAERPLTIDAFTQFIWAVEAGWVDRALADDVALVLADVRYTIAQSEIPEAAFTLLRGLAHGAALARSENLSTGVRILARNFRDRFRKLNFEQEVRIALICAAGSEDPNNWAMFVEAWLLEIGYTDLTPREAAQFRFAVKQLGFASSEFAAISSRLDAVLDATSWLSA